MNTERTGIDGNSLVMLKGTLDLVILKALSWSPMHGYEVSRQIRLRTDEAFRIEEGALYPALRRMEKKGWLVSEWGVTDTNREAKFYDLTEEGREQLAAQLGTWQRYVETMSRVLTASEALA